MHVSLRRLSKSCAASTGSPAPWENPQIESAGLRKSCAPPRQRLRVVCALSNDGPRARVDKRRYELLGTPTCRGIDIACKSCMKNAIGFERILCPTDFSVFSDNALRHALALARTFKARLKVVHVIPRIFPSGDSMYSGAPWLSVPELKQDSEDAMYAFLQPAREARVDHEHELREGDPWREILGAVQEMRSDLVVLGTHGRSGFERLFLGSVAEKLIRRLPCSVLSVSHEEGRTWTAPGLITRVLCATDFSDTSIEATRVAGALAKRYGAALTLLHVDEALPPIDAAGYLSVSVTEQWRHDRQQHLLKQLDVAAATLENKCDVMLIVGRAYREILRVASELRADLVVIGAQGHGPIEHFFSGSNAQHIVRRATCPVLTIRPLLHGVEVETRPKALAPVERAKGEGQRASAQ